MADTYSQIYIQIVFAVKGREKLIDRSFREELQKYITGIIEKRNNKMISIYCMPDHVHILIGMRPTTMLSDLVKDVKAGSSKFINDKQLVKGKFAWQHGFGAFSYSHSAISNVVNYINNQEAHHAKKNFRNEYLEFLKKFDVTYKEEFVFE
ncbi:MAG: IS200/IS605 family transposase [Bacteroidia bacterium]